MNSAYMKRNQPLLEGMFNDRESKPVPYAIAIANAVDELYSENREICLYGYTTRRFQ